MSERLNSVSTRYHTAAAALHFFLSLKYNVTLNGAENIPKGGPCIVSPNHIGQADPYLLAASLDRELTFVMRYDRKFGYLPAIVEQIRLIGAPALFGVIILDRSPKEFNSSRWSSDKISQPPTLRDTYEKTLGALAAGQAVCIFPQGTWHNDPNDPIGELKPGVAHLALNPRASYPPVIPVGFSYPQRDNTTFRKEVNIKVGEPIDTSKFKHTRKGRMQLTSQLAEAMFELVE